MNERITLISLLEKDSINKLDDIVETIPEKLCKVPYGRNVTNRMKADTLPSHFTICVWNVSELNNILNLFENLHFSPFKVWIDGVELKEGKEDSYILYYRIKPSKELTDLQSQVYNYLKENDYNPQSYQLHMTIHIDKNKARILRIKELINRNFKPFSIVIHKIGLFQIYPAVLIKEIEAE